MPTRPRWKPHETGHETETTVTRGANLSPEHRRTSRPGGRRKALLQGGSYPGRVPRSDYLESLPISVVNHPTQTTLPSDDPNTTRPDVIAGDDMMAPPSSYSQTTLPLD
jgi:hypothetical protein